MELYKTNKNKIVNAALLIASIVVISLFFPSEDKFRYEYEQGKPWAYSLLTAPFDMPIRMDSVTMRDTNDRIDAIFAPIYERDSRA